MPLRAPYEVVIYFPWYAAADAFDIPEEDIGARVAGHDSITDRESGQLVFKYYS